MKTIIAVLAALIISGCAPAPSACMPCASIDTVTFGDARFESGGTVNLTGYVNDYGVLRLIIDNGESEEYITYRGDFMVVWSE